MGFARALLVIAALAAPAGGVATDDHRQVWQAYDGQLAATCPAKHLEWLAPAELRDALDRYETHLPAAARQASERAERRRCAGVAAGATCANSGTIEVAEARGALPRLAAAVCGQFATCRAQSDCDPIAAATLDRAIRERGPRAAAAGLSDEALDRALDAAAAGRADWLAAVAALRPGLDGGRAEGVDQALSDALRTNPGEVLRLMRARPELPRPAWLCEDRAIEPSRAEARVYAERATAAVAQVRDPRLRALRDACLASLRRSAA